MTPHLDATHLAVERLVFAQSLSDITLHASGNLAYLKLEEENVALRGRVDQLQCVIH